MSQASAVFANEPCAPHAPASEREHHASHPGRTAALTVGAIGVVFGDIGTSPLYAFREALAQAASDGLYREEIIGVMSLMIWALILVVTVKYVVLLMRADNQGEGGVLALCALAAPPRARMGGAVLLLGAIGASLFYGDAIITPALSVLSAVEGLRSLPGEGNAFSQAEVLRISVVILVGLFAIQSRGTASVSRLFGPVCIVWFLALAALGLIHIADGPGILAAFLPSHAFAFMLDHGVLGLFVLGAVFLTVTGAEALTADMGHFGKLPIRVGWTTLVFPALTLNYLGQGAFAIKALAASQQAHVAFVNQDWFFQMIPDGVRLPMVLLATLATIIASQAVITGAYSLTQQAMQLGLLPRLRIRQTSAGHEGQIYVPAINWLVLAGVLALALGFRTSSRMAAAYGIAVTGTMVVTCCLAYLVMRRRWGWSKPLAALVIAPFLALDTLFFGANILRVVEGGWVPLMVGAGVLGLILIWMRGRAFVIKLESDGATPMAATARSLTKRPPSARVEGTAIFLTTDNTITPHALLHNIKHNKVLHRHNYITTVRTLRAPYGDPENRVALTRIDENFAQVKIRYGFMETPQVRDDLIKAGSLIPDAAKASFFIGRNNYVMSADVGMPIWQDIVFLTLYRNSANPTDYFNIPSNRVIELGAQHVI